MRRSSWRVLAISMPLAALVGIGLLAAPAAHAASEATACQGQTICWPIGSLGG
jgi:hypothetical protein